jgi:prepilin-type N-terminal cleavage/methylation domain-containing protein
MHRARPSGRRNRPGRGISLPEVLTVIAIIGIVSAAAVPRFLRFTATSRLESAAELLAKDIEWSRLAATRSGSKIYLRFLPASDTCKYEIWMENSNPTDYLFGTDDSLLKRVAIDPAVTFGGLDHSIPPAPQSPDSTVPASGFSNGRSDEICRDDGIVPGQGTWDHVVAFCGGSTSHMEAGTVYLSLRSYSDLAEAIEMDDRVSFKQLRYTWRGQWAER